jgi:hypothetical protein
MQPLKVNIADPEAIRQALAEATQKVNEKKKELAHWTTLRNRLSVLNAELRPEPGSGGATVQQAILAVFDQIARPARAADIAALLPADLKRDTINWALWKSEADGYIQKLDTGLYAPLDYEPETQEELLAANNGAAADQTGAESRPVTLDEAP